MCAPRYNHTWANQTSPVHSLPTTSRSATHRIYPTRPYHNPKPPNLHLVFSDSAAIQPPVNSKNSSRAFAQCCSIFSEITPHYSSGQAKKREKKGPNLAPSAASSLEEARIPPVRNFAVGLISASCHQPFSTHLCVNLRKSTETRPEPCLLSSAFRSPSSTSRFTRYDIRISLDTKLCT